MFCVEYKHGQLTEHEICRNVGSSLSDILADVFRIEEAESDPLSSTSAPTVLLMKPTMIKY